MSTILTKNISRISFLFINTEIKRIKLNVFSELLKPRLVGIMVKYLVTFLLS